jgi:hypothetical protein
MKRSEMVAKFQLILEEWESSRLDLKAADQILAKLEEAGMAPPETRSDIYLRSECDYAFVNEWDKE